jgi:hypothetical protein
MPDNQDLGNGQDNQDQGAGGGAGADGGAAAAAAAAGSAPGGAAAPSFKWKDKVGADLSKAPFMGKFEDTPDGLGKLATSYSSLEKLLGHDKVPIPKDANDVEGWNVFSKAMGIPDKAEAYGLPDAVLPDSMKGITIDKKQFAEIVHAHKLTPSQANGLWKAYTELNVQAFDKAMASHKEVVTKVVNQLKSEWGDAYDGNIELGQMVINKFSDDQETNDYITAQLTQDPRGVKFLAKLGNQFAENKMGEFSYKRFSLAPEQAQQEIQKILKDPKHPYNDIKAPNAEHQAAIDYVNSLYAVINKAKG